MKKIFRSLITIALCAPLLSGCAFLDWLEDDGTSQNQNQTAEKTKLIGLELSDYTDEVEKGATYTYDGKITAKYEGGATAELKNEDVTFSTLSTATANVTRTLKVSYTDKYKENGTEKEVTEKAEAKIKVISTLQSISASALSVGIGRTKSLNVKFEPNDATYKDLQYSSSNESVATVSPDGKVTGHADGTAKITVKSKTYESITTEVNVSVSELALDTWTVLIYMCGSNLESGWDDEYGEYLPDEYSYAASSDLDEIKKLKASKPDDVNIVIEAGGSKRWKSSYQSLINKDKLSRFHLTNSGYESDGQITKEDMGDKDTLKDFIDWGIETYPADKMALIFWNHGGGLYGCCNDELSGGVLLDNEVVTAVSEAFSSNGIDKFEWVGYDCCLMQTMEVAEFNSEYFNYMVASQESESGYGWAYDKWLDNLFNGDSTETILSEIVDTFIEFYGGVDATGQYDSYHNYYPADQTLSVLDLTKMAAFKSKWESLATATASKITNSNKDDFKDDILEKIQHFAGSDYTYFAEFDAKHYLSYLTENSTFNPGGNYISETVSAFSNLVIHNLAQKEASANAYGLSFYFGNSYNSSTYTSFTNWTSLIKKVGGYSYYGY